MLKIYIEIFRLTPNCVQIKRPVFILVKADDFRLYPAHDYKGNTVTSVAEEKAFNPRLTKTKEDFIKVRISKVSSTYSEAIFLVVCNPL
jgi:hypothetical protein